MPGEVVQNLETNMIGTISNVCMTAHAEILDHQKVMFDIQCDHLRSVYVSDPFYFIDTVIVFFIPTACLLN